MKKTIFSFLLLTLILRIDILAQDYSALKDIPLNNREACKKAETKVLECCNYLLSTPCAEDMNNKNSIAFIIDWMWATPDYTFSKNNDIHKAVKSNDVLVGRYYAAVTKIAIEKKITDNSKVLIDESIRLFIDYCMNPKYKVEITDKLQSFININK
jgi:hypothetical protein